MNRLIPRSWGEIFVNNFLDLSVNVSHLFLRNICRWNIASASSPSPPAAPINDPAQPFKHVHGLMGDQWPSSAFDPITS